MFGIDKKTGLLPGETHRIWLHNHRLGSECARTAASPDQPAIPDARGRRDHRPRPRYPGTPHPSCRWPTYGHDRLGLKTSWRANSCDSLGPGQYERKWEGISAVMRLSYAFLANAAEFTPADGRVWVLGGDFDTLAATAFPATHPVMTLVVKISAEPTECHREHRLRIELIDSDGTQIQQIQAQFTPEVRPQYPHRSVGIGVAMNFQGITFPRPSNYSFHILVDDLELGTVALYLVQAALLSQ